MSEQPSGGQNTGGGANKNEVRVALVMDDKASETLAKVAAALEKVAGSQQHVQQEAKKTEGIWGQIKSTAIGTALGGAISGGFHYAMGAVHKGVEMLQEAFHAGIGELEGQRSMAGVLLMTDTNERSFEATLDRAGLFKDTLEDIGIEAGVSADVLQEVFEGIAARSNKTALEVEELTEKIAQAGKAVPGGARALSAGFQQIEMGMVRARNPVVQLIAASHLLKGNAKAVAKEMQKMAPEKQFELAEKAMTKIADKMKNAPPTWANLMTSMEGVKDQAFEALGVPLVQGLLPVLNEVRNFLVANKDAIYDGLDKTAEAFLSFKDDAQAAFEGLWKEINIRETKELLTDGAKALLSAFKFGYETFKFVLQVGSEFLGGVAKLYSSVKEGIKEDAKKGTFGDLGKRMEFGSQASTLEDQVREKQSMAVDPEERAKLQKQLTEWSVLQDKIRAAGGEVSAEQMQTFAALQENVDHYSQMGTDLKKIVDSGSTENFTAKYADAAKLHERGVQLYLAKMLAGNEALQDALVKAGFDAEGGFQGLIKTMKEAGMTSEADKLTLKVKADGAKATHVTNFNGGQTFNIKQDFRDQDPDRVAVVFRQDILKASNARVMSRNAMPFGF